MIRITSVMIREVNMTKEAYIEMISREVDVHSLLVHYDDLKEKGRSFALVEGGGDKISHTIEIKEI